MSPRIISHRGKVDLNSSENDLVGTKEAIQLGVDMVEFDVRKTRDDVLICHHDTKVKGVSVSNLSYNEIKYYNSNSFNNSNLKVIVIVGKILYQLLR